MPGPGKDLIEVDAYTAKVHVPLTGEPVMAADLENASQALANRAKNHETHGLWDTLKSALGSDKVYKLKAGGELFLTTATSVIRGTAAKIKGSFTVEAAMTFTGGIIASTVTSTFNSGVDILGALTASGGAAFPVGSVVQYGDKDIHVGDDAYSSRRAAAGPGSTTTVQLWKQDVWICPTLAAGHTWTLDHPPSSAIVMAIVLMPVVGAGALALADAGTFATIGTGFLNSAIVVFDGTKWRLAASS